MKITTTLLFLFSILFFEKKTSAQTDPVRLLPAFDSLMIEGEAFFFTEKYRVILGGRYCNIDPEIEACDFNADILVLERTGKRVWAVPLSNLPTTVAEHFSAVGLCTAADEKGMAWVAGGYGYDGESGNFTTIGQLTSFPLEKTVAALLAGENTTGLFSTVVDANLAVFDGRLMKIGDWFLLFGGHRAEPVFVENSDRPTHLNKISLEGELRTWRLECNATGQCAVADFQACEQPPTLFQCLPKHYYLDEKTAPPIDIDIK